MKLFKIFLATLCLSCLISQSINAAMIFSNEAPIGPGENVLSAAAFNDSPGSSDLSLAVQLEIDGEILIDRGDECMVIQPLENIPSDNDPIGWTQPKFDDSDWLEGAYGVGYGDGDDETVIGDGQHAAVYTRAIFKVSRPGSIKSVRVGADYDDACVIWINGVEVARESGTDIPEEPEWDSWSDQGSGHSHEATGQFAFVDVDFKVVGSVFAVNYAEKLASTWAAVKQSR